MNLLDIDTLEGLTTRNAGKLIGVGATLDLLRQHRKKTKRR